jgi:hypothetical protein
LYLRCEGAAKWAILLFLLEAETLVWVFIRSIYNLQPKN